MASKQQLIKEVATEIKWSQADVKRALEAYGDFSTKEDIYACCLRYAGPEMKKRNYELRAQKQVNSNHNETIKNLVEQLTNVKNFYSNQLIPTLEATIAAQSDQIKELLKQMPWAS